MDEDNTFARARKMADKVENEKRDADAWVDIVTRLRDAETRVRELESAEPCSGWKADAQTKYRGAKVPGGSEPAEPAYTKERGIQTMTFAPRPDPAYPAWKKRNVLKVKRMSPHAKMPTRAHAEDAGLDLYVSSMWDTDIEKGDFLAVPLGIAVEIPKGHVGLIVGRSGAAARREYTVQTGVVDSGYRGAIAALIQFEREQVLEKNAKVAQLLIVPVAMLDPIEVDSLSDSERGDKGFGSTGL